MSFVVLNGDGSAAIPPAAPVHDTYLLAVGIRLPPPRSLDLVTLVSTGGGTVGVVNLLADRGDELLADNAAGEFVKGFDSLPVSRSCCCCGWRRNGGRVVLMCCTNPPTEKGYGASKRLKRALRRYCCKLNPPKRKKTMKRTLMMAVVLSMMTSKAHAQNYRKEIEKYVVDPCFTYLAEKSDAIRRLGMSKEETLEMVKDTLAEHVADMEKAILKAVVGKPPKVRAARYKFARKSCIKGAQEVYK